MMQVLTPWMPGTTKPVRDGEYLTRIDRWDEFPTLLCWSIDRWIGVRHSPIGNQNVQWRGLAFDPHSAADYARANPLGGPAAVFDAVADSIRAGDPVDKAMRVYGVAWVQQP